MMIGLASPADGQDRNLLQVVALTKRFGGQVALADVAFSVRAGEVLGLIGPNGAGKTTLLETMAGVLPADAGSVLWRGTPLSQARRRDALFYVPDVVRPYRDQYVARVLTFFRDAYGRTLSQAEAAIADVGLAPVLGHRVDALSKGYARRLLLAIGLLTPQPLLMMDEPFDGFDLRQTREMMAVLRRVAAAGRTLLLSIHQLNDAERVCDRFVLLAGGRVRGAGTREELRAQASQASGSLEDIFLALA
jgi:ABC-2 type transport system ATP-binding protein